MRMNIEPGTVKEKITPAATDRCVMMRMGTVAPSPMRNWMYRKKVMRTPPRTKSAMIRVLLHG